MTSQSKELLFCFLKSVTVLFQYPIQGPYRTRLCRYLQGDFHKLFLAMLDNVDYIHCLQDDGIGEEFTRKFAQKH